MLKRGCGALWVWRKSVSCLGNLTSWRRNPISFECLIFCHHEGFWVLDFVLCSCNNFDFPSLPRWGWYVSSLSSAYIYLEIRLIIWGRYTNDSLVIMPFFMALAWAYFLYIFISLLSMNLILMTCFLIHHKPNQNKSNQTCQQFIIYFYLIGYGETIGYLGGGKTTHQMDFPTRYTKSLW